MSNKLITIDTLSRFKENYDEYLEENYSTFMYVEANDYISLDPFTFSLSQDDLERILDIAPMSLVVAGETSDKEDFIFVAKPVTFIDEAITYQADVLNSETGGMDVIRMIISENDSTGNVEMQVSLESVSGGAQIDFATTAQILALFGGGSDTVSGNTWVASGSVDGTTLINNNVTIDGTKVVF